jgi:hypothetical protein
MGTYEEQELNEQDTDLETRTNAQAGGVSARLNHLFLRESIS